DLIEHPAGPTPRRRSFNVPIKKSFDAVLAQPLGELEHPLIVSARIVRIADEYGLPAHVRDTRDGRKQLQLYRKNARRILSPPTPRREGRPGRGRLGQDNEGGLQPMDRRYQNQPVAGTACQMRRRPSSVRTS